MSRTVLVTGANGYIGSLLVDRLLETTGDHVRCMVLKGTDESNLAEARTNARCSIVHADLLDKASLDQVLGGIDTVYHLAALVTDWAPRALFFTVIVDGTRHLVEAAIAAGCRRLVYMSSLTVHGLGGHLNADETTPIDPVPFFPYAGAKAEAEAYLASISTTTSLETVRVRPGFDIIGPRNVTGFYEVASNLERGRFGFMNGGKAMICLVAARNLAAAMIHLANLPEAAGQAYNVIDASWTWKRYVGELCTRLGCKEPRLDVRYGVVAPLVILGETMAKAFKRKTPPALTRYRISIPRRDIDFHARKLLATGFVPPTTLEAALDEAVAWYRHRKSTLAAPRGNT